MAFALVVFSPSEPLENAEDSLAEVDDPGFRL